MGRKLKTDFQVFVKPVGDRCNLACRYCYYSSVSRVPGNVGAMTDAMLETYIFEHLHAHPGPVVRFSWHGGEPTLAGIDFYQRAVAFQKKHQPPGVAVQNAVQTNGTLLDDAWCTFFKKQGFTVGLSLDGPEHLHDSCRVTPSGKGTHSRALRGQQLLKRYKIPHDILCVVHHHNVDHPLGVYGFFREIGAACIGFLPVVNSVTDAVDPEKYGAFLCTVFDAWKARDIGRIRVQMFEEVVAAALDQPHALCVFRDRCGEIPVVEVNGDVYPCDHFVRPAHRLGNLSQTGLERLMTRKSMQSFGRQKKAGLAPQCRLCPVLPFCNGGCPKDRIVALPGSSAKLNLLCPAYVRFFTHCLGFVQALQELSPVKTARNAPCPCGSGKKFKRCCGAG